MYRLFDNLIGLLGNLVFEAKDENHSKYYIIRLYGSIKVNIGLHICYDTVHLVSLDGWSSIFFPFSKPIVHLNSPACLDMYDHVFML